MRRENGSQPAFGELFTGDEPRWTPRLQEQAESGLVFRAPTIADLADIAGIDSPALEATVARYNAACSRGDDDQFMKDACFLQPLTEPPYYAVVVRPSVVALTGCGVRIDPSARVLDTHDRPIQRGPTLSPPGWRNSAAAMP